ncbi:hypothetical protein LO762_15670 [Actinocorallia sp. API 0066]|uniref:hypothetical protein n=1 Tax=Actinocorallia sp. API 0066 TaxID=2896846 RepID=UPI001E3B12F6|nr:hypothetical protein [Actinocorallia sp. API 0066]MCD0450617.1 hypothetical protein [Actinocorallia sp. API 0066]
MTSDDIGANAITQTVTITGTRDVGHRPVRDYAAVFGQFVRPFAPPSATFHVGGAVGIDSLALLWLAEETGARIVVVVPASLGDQPDEARRAVAAAERLGRLDELVELGLETRTAGYHSRNRWMVDRSSFVIGFPLSGTEAGGTGYTLEYAKRLHKPRLIVPV